MDHLRPAPPKASKTHKPKVFVADGKEIPLRGTCLLFTKVADANTVITEQNMTKVLKAFSVMNVFFQENDFW